MSIKPQRYPRCCAACEHCITYNRAAFQYECEAPGNIDEARVDIVTGHAQYRDMNCYEARANEAGCGLAGKWWVAKVEQQLTPAVRVERLAAKNQSASVDDLGL